MKVQLIRTYQPKQTIGKIVIDGVEAVKTLELPWKENQRNVSCIPEGIYTVVKRKGHERRPYEHFHIKNVPNRSWILIHRGTYVWHVLGCVLVGLDHVDLNKDGLLDVVSSTTALNRLLDLLPGQFELEVCKG